MDDIITEFFKATSSDQTVRPVFLNGNLAVVSQSSGDVSFLEMGGTVTSQVHISPPRLCSHPLASMPVITLLLSHLHSGS